MSGRSVPIAVIDSGIHAGHPHLAGVPVEGLAVTSGSGGLGLVPDDRDVHGHGTAVAAAIARRGAPVRLIGVRVLDRALRCEAAALAFAIEAGARRGAVLINCSLATDAEGARDPLAAAVARAGERGAWVVAAAPATGRGWPADLDGVIAAVAEPGCPPGRCVPRGPLRFGAHGAARPPEGRPRAGNLAGNSLAAAHLTALAAELVAGGGIDSVARLAGELADRFGGGQRRGGHG